jgi:hypothetical protein
MHISKVKVLSLFFHGISNSKFVPYNQTMNQIFYWKFNSESLEKEAKSLARSWSIANIKDRTMITFYRISEGDLKNVSYYGRTIPKAPIAVQFQKETILKGYTTGISVSYLSFILTVWR